MNCRSVESLFSSYVEDEISQEERRHLEAHLMGCRRCSLAMREVRATMSLLEQMPAIAPSQNFD
ncbi:MAG TPA: zf-HC2 domain-containing protein, partial [Candidatus Angelobacter sp.]|nr:zf-HC2 domain-containing protein [Candidatus Angelobacter sp.]